MLGVRKQAGQGGYKAADFRVAEEKDSKQHAHRSYSARKEAEYAPRQHMQPLHALPRPAAHERIRRCGENVNQIGRGKIRTADHRAREKRPGRRVCRAGALPRRSGNDAGQGECIKRNGVIAQAHHVKRREQHENERRRKRGPAEFFKPEVHDYRRKGVQGHIVQARGEHDAVIRAVYKPVKPHEGQSQEGTEL